MAASTTAGLVCMPPTETCSPRPTRSGYAWTPWRFARGELGFRLVCGEGRRTPLGTEQWYWLTVQPCLIISSDSPSADITDFESDFADQVALSWELQDL